MAVRPGYKKRYTREEYKELQRQEALAALPWEIASEVTQGDLSQQNLINTLEGQFSIDSSDTSKKTVVSQGWYVLGAALIAGLGAGAIYRLGATKKGKRASKFDEKIAASLDLMSANIAGVMRAAAPVMAFPAAYIGVQALEDHGMISGGFGNDVQALMATTASGSLIGGLLGIVKAAI